MATGKETRVYQTLSINSCNSDHFNSCCHNMTVKFLSVHFQLDDVKLYGNSNLHRGVIGALCVLCLLRMALSANR